MAFAVAGKKIQDERQLKALTGVSLTEFQDILAIFHQLIVANHRNRQRTRVVGGGRTGKLGGLSENGSAMKLLFILIWLKTYPTYDVFGFIVGLERSRCQRWVIFLLPVLEASLDRKIVLPERKITSVEEFQEKFPGVKDVFIDGSERPIQKPVDSKRKKKVYSGKKKTTTRKHVMAVDEHERVLILGKSKTGRRHDKRIAERQQLLQAIPDEVDAWVDTGFSGMQHTRPPDKTHIPTRASKHRALTDKEKANNHIIGSFRVVVEHAIGHVKRYKAAADIWRSRTPGQDDQVMLLAAGLWNLHLNHRAGIVSTG